MVDVGKNLPRYYDKSRYIKALQTPTNAEFDRLNAKIDTFVLNRFVETADEDTVRRLERDFSLEPSDSLEVRKSRILARIRGAQPATEKNVVNAIRSFDSSAFIEQHTDTFSFMVHLKVPAILPEVMALVEDIKPAHLAVGYDISPENTSITYIGIGAIIEAGAEMPFVEYAATYDDIRNQTYEQLRNKTYLEILIGEETE